VKHTEKQIQQGNMTWWAIIWEMVLGVFFPVFIHASTICLWTHPWNWWRPESAV
jgi:hypothetical protein